MRSIIQPLGRASPFWALTLTFPKEATVVAMSKNDRRLFSRGNGDGHGVGAQEHIHSPPGGHVVGVSNGHINRRPDRAAGPWRHRRPPAPAWLLPADADPGQTRFSWLSSMPSSTAWVTATWPSPLSPSTRGADRGFPLHLECGGPGCIHLLRSFGHTPSSRKTPWPCMPRRSASIIRAAP